MLSVGYGGAQLPGGVGTQELSHGKHTGLPTWRFGHLDSKTFVVGFSQLTYPLTRTTIRLTM